MSQLVDVAADPRAGNVADYDLERSPCPTVEQRRVFSLLHEQAVDGWRRTVIAVATRDVARRFHSVEAGPASPLSHGPAITISINVVRTAEATIAGINNLLRALRELTVHAANSGVNQAHTIRAGQAQIIKSVLFTRQQIDPHAGSPMLTQSNQVPHAIPEMV